MRARGKPYIGEKHITSTLYGSDTATRPQSSEPYSAMLQHSQTLRLQLHNKRQTETCAFSCTSILPHLTSAPAKADPLSSRLSCTPQRSALGVHTAAMPDSVTLPPPPPLHPPVKAFKEPRKPCPTHYPHCHWRYQPTRRSCTTPLHPGPCRSPQATTTTLPLSRRPTAPHDPSSWQAPAHAYKHPWPRA